MSQKKMNETSIEIRKEIEKEVPLTLGVIVKALTEMGIQIL